MLKKPFSRLEKMGHIDSGVEPILTKPTWVTLEWFLPSFQILNLTHAIPSFDP